MDFHFSDQPTITEENKNGYSPLHLAILEKNEKLVNQLLEGGCQPNVTDYRGQTPLHLAVKDTFQKGVELLLANQSDVNAQDEDGNTPFHLVYKFQYWETDGGEDLDHDDKMHIVVGRRYRNVLCKLMINNRADLKIKNVKGQTLLHLAVLRNMKSMCCFILKKCNNINVLDENLQTPLLIATMKGYYSLSKILLTKGALVNLKDFNGNYPLHYAVIAGNKKLVKLLLNNGAEIGVKNVNGHNALHIAVKDLKCQSRVVEFLLERRVEINEQDINGDTPLHLAVESRRMNNVDNSEVDCVIKLLLDWGADMEIRNLSGVTPLDRAANVEWGNIIMEHIVKLRVAKPSNNVQYQFDGNLPEEYEQSCLEELDRMKLFRFADYSMYDLICNSDDSLSLLGSEQDDIIPCFESFFPKYYTLLRAKLIKAKQRKVLLPAARKCLDISLPPAIVDKILYFVNDKDLENIISANEKHACDYLNLTTYIKHNWYRFVDNFSQENVSFFRAIKIRSLHNLKACVQETPLPLGKLTQPGDILHYAVKKDFGEGVTFLLESGTDINSKGVRGETALHCAALKHKETIADILINNGADIDSKNDCGKTPLDLAVSAHNVYVTELLLDKGCNVNAKDKDMNSQYLLRLFNNGDYEKNTAEMLDLLITHGADVNFKDSDGLTSLMHAVASDCNAKMCQLLLDSGADINCVDNKKRTPLHVICKGERNPEEVCKMLLKRGANVDARDIKGRTPLHLAAKHSTTEVLKLLAAEGGDVATRDLKGQTVLHFAAKNDYGDNRIRFLLENGVDVNPRDASGETPLQIFLSWYEPKSIVIELMDWGGPQILEHYQNNMTTLMKYANHFKWSCFVKCIVKLHCAKIIETTPYVFMSNKLQLFQQTCFLELKIMKRTIFGQNTCFDIISNYSDPLYVLNKELEDALSSDELKSEFPIYSSFLYVTFLKAKKRFSLLNSAQEHFKLDLPPEAIRHILTFLSDNDLKNFVNTLFCKKVVCVS